MKKTKQILSILLAILMIVLLTPMAFASNIVKGDVGNIHWELDRDSGVLTITGSGAMPDYNDSRLTPWYNYNRYIQSVSIGNGITSVGECAFGSCKNLISVSLQNSLQSIRKYAFSNCSNIEIISIPESVTSIESSAFSSCTLLSEINVPKDITVISDKTFANCSSLTNLVLPDNVRSIGDSAFSGCTRLASINIPKKVISIGESAFYSCEALTSITLPDELASIGGAAFRGCKELKTVIVPNSVQTIDESAFRECANLTDITFSNSVTEIADWMFYKSEKLQSFIVPNKVKYIRYQAFNYCSFLSEVSIPKSVTTIEEYAFRSCSRLSDVYYEGTEEEWNAITISSNNNSLRSATIHYNADPSIWVPQEANPYNLGEETYSFDNFSDDQSAGHCFGMSMTSSGYYNDFLDISILGDSTVLYDYENNDTVRAPICYYQARQGSRAAAAIVAGGSAYRNSTIDIDADWTAVINYVKNHASDDKGTLQIGYRGRTHDRDGNIVSGGHAINFLRYEEVDGEERIYAYDNNFPNIETYFYKDGNGDVKQAPRETFDVSIDSIALRNVATYFSLVGSFDLSRVIYADADEIAIDGLFAYPMDGDVETGEHVMYELPDTAAQVRIIPQSDGATFTYLEKEYRFDAVDADTYGVLTLSSTEDGTGTLVIENAPTTPDQPDTPDTPDPEPQDLCPWCGGEHVGFFQGIIGWFHGLLARIFGARY